MRFTPGLLTKPLITIGCDKYVRLLRKRTHFDWAVLALLLAFFCLCCPVYFLRVKPWIDYQAIPRYGADSDQYWMAAKEFGNHNAGGMVTLTANFLGPSLLGYLLRTGFAVLCFNILLFCLSLKIAISLPGVKKSRFALAMLLNAEILPSVTTLNKEILVLFSSVLFARYLYSEKHSKLLLCFTLLISFAARWEQAAIMILFLLFRRTRLRSRPWQIVAIVVLGITILYPVAVKVLGISTDLFDYLIAGGGLIVRLNDLQSHFLFPLALVPKFLMNMVGRLATPSDYLSGRFIEGAHWDMQQVVFQPLGCAAYIVVFFTALFGRRLRMNRPLVLLATMTSIVTSATPFIQPRYLFGPYVWICLELSMPFTAPDRRPYAREWRRVRVESRPEISAAHIRP